MLEEHERKSLADQIAAGIATDVTLLNDLIADIHRGNLISERREVNRHSATAVAIVSSDAGNMRLKFDPFEHQIIRVVDSDGATLALRPVTVTTDLKALFRRDVEPDGDGVISAVGRLVLDLRRATGDPIASYKELCPSINVDESKNQPERNTGWVLTYRDLWEWAVLYERLMYAQFAQSTIVVRDGLLRTKIFGNTRNTKSNYFRVMGDLLARRFLQLRRNVKKDIYLVGLAKHSQVLDLYRLVWSKLNVFPAGQSWYVRIPRAMEIRTYEFPEFARGRERLAQNADGLCADTDEVTGRNTLLGLRPDREDKDTEDSKFVFGTMHFARFGPELSLPMWAVDIFDDQVRDGRTVMGHLFNDAQDGFPVPCYPQSIQRAHEAAKLTDFDAIALNEIIMNGIRGMIEDDAIIDRLLLAGDVAARRY